MAAIGRNRPALTLSFSKHPRGLKAGSSSMQAVQLKAGSWSMQAVELKAGSWSMQAMQLKAGTGSMQAVLRCDAGFRSLPFAAGEGEG